MEQPSPARNAHPTADPRPTFYSLRSETRALARGIMVIPAYYNPFFLNPVRAWYGRRKALNIKPKSCVGLKSCPRRLLCKEFGVGMPAWPAPCWWSLQPRQVNQNRKEAATAPRKLHKSVRADFMASANGMASSASLNGLPLPATRTTMTGVPRNRTEVPRGGPPFGGRGFFFRPSGSSGRPPFKFDYRYKSRSSDDDDEGDDDDDDDARDRREEWMKGIRAMIERFREQRSSGGSSSWRRPQGDGRSSSSRSPEDWMKGVQAMLERLREHRSSGGSSSWRGHGSRHGSHSSGSHASRMSGFMSMLAKLREHHSKGGSSSWRGHHSHHRHHGHHGSHSSRSHSSKMGGFMSMLARLRSHHSGGHGSSWRGHHSHHRHHGSHSSRSHSSRMSGLMGMLARLRSHHSHRGHHGSHGCRSHSSRSGGFMSMLARIRGHHSRGHGSSWRGHSSHHRRGFCPLRGRSHHSRSHWGRSSSSHRGRFVLGLLSRLRHRHHGHHRGCSHHRHHGHHRGFSHRGTFFALARFPLASPRPWVLPPSSAFHAPPFLGMARRLSRPFALFAFPVQPQSVGTDNFPYQKSLGTWQPILGKFRMSQLSV